MFGVRVLIKNTIVNHSNPFYEEMILTVETEDVNEIYSKVKAYLSDYCKEYVNADNGIVSTEIAYISEPFDADFPEENGVKEVYSKFYCDDFEDKSKDIYNLLEKWNLNQKTDSKIEDDVKNDMENDINCDFSPIPIGFENENIIKLNENDMENEERAELIIKKYGFDFDKIPKQEIIHLIKKELTDFHEGSSEYIRVLCGYLFCIGDREDCSLIEKAKYDINMDVGCMIDGEWIESLKNGGIAMEMENVPSRSELIEDFISYYRHYFGGDDK